MKRLIILFLLSLFLTGCTTVETLIMGTDHMEYKQQLAEIEQGYKEGKLTYAEYMQLKLQLEQTYTLKGIDYSIKDKQK